MPIRFPCQACGRLLSIAQRKIGASIDCPKCGHTQIVPDPKAEHQGIPEQIVDDENRPEPGDLVAPEMVLVSRRALYTQGVLLVAVGVVGLVVGYLIGRGHASLESARRQDTAGTDRVLVEGKLLYRPAIDKVEGDENAVAIFLPEKKKRAKRIETAGIRPEDAPPPGYTSLRKIRASGGAYARSDRHGDFSVVLPRGGKYFVLLISAASQRPADSAPEPLDLEDLDRYFRRPEYLIGRRKYRWTLEDLSGYARIEHDFGRDRER